MGIRELFHRRATTTQRADAHGEPAASTDPGSVSSPQDVDGQGTVGLSDRTATSGAQGSPDTNQAKAEPMPATPGHADPAAALQPPDLADMNVGSADPQSPSHPAALDRGGLAGGSVPDQPVATGQSPAAEFAAGGNDRASGSSDGASRPLSVGDGRAQRVPGSLGASPEEQETDVSASAAAMDPGTPAGVEPAPVQPGDSQGVSVPHDQPATGSSEEQDIVRGARTPAALDEPAG